MTRHALRAALLLALAAGAACADEYRHDQELRFRTHGADRSAGSTVTWRNDDEEPHTVVSQDGLFRSAAIDGGDTSRSNSTSPEPTNMSARSIQGWSARSW